jgi:hypothetical protein
MQNRFIRWAAAVMCCCLSLFSAGAQGEASVVPDLTGLTIPQAAAQLNKAGIAFGSEIAVPLAEGVTADVISGQSVAPGEPVMAGMIVDVEIPRSANVRLFYDDNDLTMMNLANANIAIQNLVFETVEGSRDASFNASRWAKQLRAKQCTQIWSLNRNGPKSLPECTYIQNWLTTTNPAAHFWTAVSGAQTFRVVQDEVERGVCQAAPPNSQDQPVSCEFYLPAGAAGDVTQYIYVAYEEDRLVVMNNSDGQWMPVNSARIVSTLANPGPLGRQFRLNAALFGRPEIVARINRLAPKQCLLFISSGASGTDAGGLLECDVIATMHLEPSQLWWTANFSILGSDGRERTCNAALPGKLTLCIMPR